MLRFVSFFLTPRLRPGMYWLVQAGLIAIVAAACLLSVQLDLVRFSGFDVSPMIDGGWRVLQGQRVDEDFIGTFPQSLNLAVALSYHLFGLSWQAIGESASLLTGILCLLGMRLTWLLRGTLRDGRVILIESVYVVSQLTTLIYINYLWHSSMCQQIGIYAVLTSFVLLTAPNSRRILVECFFHLLPAMALLVLSKPNTAFPVVILCFAALFIGKRNRVFLILLAAAALLLSILLLHFAHSDLLHMLRAYKGLTGRLLPKPLFFGLLYQVKFGAAIDLMAWLVLVPFMGVLVQRWWRARHTLELPLLVLVTGSVIVSFLGFCTNYDYKLTDCPLLLLGSTLFLATRQGPERLLTSSLLFTTSALAFGGVFLGVTRVRMQLMDQWASDSCGPRSRISDPYFNQLKVCAAFPVMLAEADRAIKDLPPRGNVFFGSSMEFLYVREKIASPHGLPVWWDPGTSHPLSATARINRAFQENNFALLIFSHNDDQLMTPEIADYIHRNYRLVDGNTQIDVFRHH